jgi:hypothetical protein
MEAVLGVRQANISQHLMVLRGWPGHGPPRWLEYLLPGE